MMDSLIKRISNNTFTKMNKMKLANSLLPVLLIIASACSDNSTKSTSEKQDKSTFSNSDVSYSVWMADSEIKRNPEGWMIDFRETPKWEYTNGLVSTALEKLWEHTGDEKYFRYIKNFADTMISEDGSILTYEKEIYNIDRINPGKFVIELYKETNDDKYRLAIENLRDQMRGHPRTSEGGFWHKKVYPHQMWLDGLYMGAPFLAQYAAEFDEPELFNDVAKQFYLINKYTWDEENKVYYHGWDESREQRWSDPETGLSPNVWSRAIGWLAMASVDALDFFPEGHPERDKIMQVVQNVAVAVKKYQDAETGVWWQVFDQGGREGNYLESSATTMFVYFLAKASKKGYIHSSYMDVAKKGYNGILENFIRKEEDGTISITNVCSVAGLGGNPYRDGSYEYYINEPKRDNDPKAVGPFIMASLELEKNGDI